LDTLAAGLANAVNGVQVGGFDLNGDVGTDLFNPPAASGVGRGESSVAITDPALIAASSMARRAAMEREAMYALNSQNIISGQSPTDYISGIVFNVGNTPPMPRRNKALRRWYCSSSTISSSISGVSLDKRRPTCAYQDAYSASAEVITTINDMM